jgi:hypothetical protein
LRSGISIFYSGRPKGLRRRYTPRSSVDRGVAHDVKDDGAAALPRRGRERAEQRPRQTEGPDEIGREGQLEPFALSVGEQRQRYGPRLDALLTRTSTPPRLLVTCKAIAWMSSLRARSPPAPLIGVAAPEAGDR